jgi:hypothetical protein
MKVLFKDEVLFESDNKALVLQWVIEHLYEKYGLTKEDDRCIIISSQKIEYKDGYLHDEFLLQDDQEVFA